MSETMAWLALNYKIGIAVSTSVAVLLYVLTGLLIMFKSRKLGVDVAVGSMIPIWRLKYLVQGHLRNRSSKAVVKSPTIEKS